MASKQVKLSEIQDLQIEERSVYVTWTFPEKDRKNTDKYEYNWLYHAQGVWFSGSSGSVEANGIAPLQCSYSYPEPADKVQVYVKPVSKKKPKKNEGYYYVGKKATKSKPVSVLLPDKPSDPSVSIENFTLTAQVTITDPNSVTVMFEIVNAENGASIGSPITASIFAQQATITATATYGITYRVRCRAANSAGSYGPWSNFSSDTKGETPPGPIPYAPVCEALSKNSIAISWEAAANADEYVVQYTLQPRFFDSVPAQVTETEAVTTTNTQVDGLEPDYSVSDTGRYFFRVKAKNGSGESGWSPIGSCVIGTRPDPPTTWSSRATASPNDTIYLYWTHNSVDGSREVDAVITLVAGEVTTSIKIPNEVSKDEDTGTHRYLLDASRYPDGANVKWTVKTRGAFFNLDDPSNSYSDPSIEREINIYAPPSLSLYLGSENHWFWDDLEFTEEASIHTTNGELVPMELDEYSVKTLKKYPLYIKLNASPINQAPVSYNISITSNETYEDTDVFGNPIVIRDGTEVFSRFIVSSDHDILTYVLPTDANLFDGITYTVTATLAMDSGLGAEASTTFGVDLDAADDFTLDAEPIYDEERIALSLAPYCEDDNGNLVNGISLAVYRRQADGSFIQIASGLPSEVRTYVVDPHPNLGDQLYRIVGTDNRTGHMYFGDVTPDSIPEKAIIIQWSEEIRSFDDDVVNSDDELLDEPHTGTTLRLPYNVDVQDTTNPDVAFVQYIGRKHPVSYYGTHLGETASWNCEIPYEDKETISLLRHLQAWMGDVYIREPSGLGYWAQVKPSFNLEHCKVTVPVSLAITRVEGGI